MRKLKYPKTKHSKIGWTKIEHSFLHALMRAKIRCSVLQTVMTIFRLTIGFHCEEKALSYKDVSFITGFERLDQREYIKEALKQNLIKRFRIGTRRPTYVYSVNFDVATWKCGLRIPYRDFETLLRKAMGGKHPTHCGVSTPHKLGGRYPTGMLRELIKNPWDYREN